MSSEKQNKERQSNLKITLKALQDADYKKRLMTNPEEAIKEVLPKFTTTSEIVVQDQTAPNTLYINISPSTASLLYEGADDLELSEEDLEMVSGGINRETSLGLEGEHDGFCGGCIC